jgi:hypothetical protein
MTIGWIEEFVRDGQVVGGFKDRAGLIGKGHAALIFLLCLHASLVVLYLFKGY